MKKFKKKLAAIGAAMVMASSCFSIGASATSKTETYNLRFTSGASSSDNVMTYTKTVSATSAGKITVNSTKFSTYVSGAYVYTKCTSHSANTSNINSVSKYYLIYSGTSVPKVNTNVTVKGSLTNYSVSKTVTAKGTISA